MVLVTAVWGDLYLFCHLKFDIHVWKLSYVVCKIRGKIHYKFYKLFPVSVFFFTHCISYQLYHYHWHFYFKPVLLIFLATRDVNLNLLKQTAQTLRPQLQHDHSTAFLRELRARAPGQPTVLGHSTSWLQQHPVPPSWSLPALQHTQPHLPQRQPSVLGPGNTYTL